MNHFAIAENESKARIRLNLMEKLVQPCGPPPEKKIRRLSDEISIGFDSFSSIFLLFASVRFLSL